MIETGKDNTSAAIVIWKKLLLGKHALETMLGNAIYRISRAVYIWRNFCILNEVEECNMDCNFWNPEGGFSSR
jgi:hypothetical protein